MESESLHFFFKYFEWFLGTLQLKKYYTHYSHLHRAKWWVMTTHEPSWACSEADAVMNIIYENAQVLVTTISVSKRCSWENLGTFLFICPFALHSLSLSVYQQITNMNYKRNRKKPKDSFKTVHFWENRVSWMLWELCRTLNNLRWTEFFVNHHNFEMVTYYQQ